jgi:hypothetical protein
VEHAGREQWADAAYAFEVVVYAPTVDAVVTNVVTDRTRWR